MNSKKKILYIDMDGVLVDFPSAFPHIPNDVLEKYTNDKDNIPGIFSLMQPLEGAINAYEKLSQKYDTYIISTAPWDNPSAWSDKVIWVQKYLGSSAHKRLILSHNKNLNFGDYLIDDRPNNGASEFKGERIHFRQEPFPDWQSVLYYLTEKKDG
jgi:5'(3')-deoxyribonucleotidase